MIFLIFFLCIFNVAMWLVFLRKFKKLFTTDDIIENSKNELDKVIADINRNVSRNISLVDDAISRLNSANFEAEKKIKLINDLDKQSANLSLLNSRIAEASSKTTQFGRRVESAYNQNKINPESSIRLTRQGENSVGVDFSSQTVFKAPEEGFGETEIKMREDGASYAEIPVVSASIYNQNLVGGNAKSNDALKEKIISLYERGLSIDGIAAELGCSTTEVQFALSIEGLI